MSKLSDFVRTPTESTATLLSWAHDVPRPYEAARQSAPWLEGEREIDAFFDGLIAGRLHFWRYGPLFGGPVE